MQDTKKVLAVFNNKTIRIYQAYNSKIADEALKIGTFGSSFKFDRMTWIKPSFLWMMYRSGWGRKKDQEKVLAIDILREGFNEVLSSAVLSTYDSEIYTTYDEWKRKLEESEVRCQWDPDRDIWGEPINRRAIQLGLRGSIVKKYVKEWIYKITDMTDYVHELGKMIEEGCLCPELLPKEKEYPVDKKIKRILGIQE